MSTPLLLASALIAVSAMAFNYIHSFFRKLHTSPNLCWKTYSIHYPIFQANWFRLSTELMTQVKTLQIKKKMRKQSANSEGISSPVGDKSIVDNDENLNAIKEGKKQK